MANQLRITNGHREWLATVDGSIVTIDGVEGTFALNVRPDGKWTIAHSDGTVLATTVASAVQSPGGLWIGVEGTSTPWQAQAASSRARHASVEADVRSPMSATVVRVLVAVGDTVDVGDTLLVVEAMKMEMPLRAPRAAVVRALHCNEGELVQPTTVLVELE